MKWVKLIDKQPAISERCNLKIDGAPYTGSYWKPEGHKDSQIYYEHFSIDGKGIVPKSEFENIYWLDESQSGEGYAVDGWISVEERLPEVSEAWKESEYVLAIDSNSEQQVVCWYTIGYGWRVAHHYASSNSIQVSHWRKLPKPPIK